MKDVHEVVNEAFKHYQELTKNRVTYTSQQDIWDNLIDYIEENYVLVKKDNDLEQTIKTRIEEIRKDERLSYKPATVFSNAPLALIQCGRMAVLNELENLIGLEPSTLPINK